MKEFPELPPYQHEYCKYSCYSDLIKENAFMNVEKRCPETGRWLYVTKVKLNMVSEPSKCGFFNGYRPARLKHRFKDEKDILIYCKNLCDYYGPNTRMWLLCKDDGLLICGPRYRMHVLYQEGKWI